MGGPEKLTTADIRLCPELGLNVHGKALCVVPYSLEDVEVITGKNVHRRLRELVAARWADWEARRTPAGVALTVTLDAAPVSLDGSGAFDVSVPAPAAGGATLVATTADGDATTLAVP
jgi:hypothetical protein